ncbi:hypothetical protein PR202_gb05909 [Eleusine coracana subsp. coracana]|uniref:Dienelactone hydrolase domain-containing protein n=1 Tax=Eleusine coracana subsp. coracana TaxID=191504 RepID=A0AAV5E868_ELECO|nr:hypothetical protein PR202_gb05909 [Eleusine coracana subsp. coracana]
MAAARFCKSDGGSEAGEAAAMVTGMVMEDGGREAAAVAGRAVVGVTGYCMGGALSIASGVLVPEVDGVVAFYGTPSSELADPSKAKAPIQAHFGEHDNFVGFSDVTVSWCSAGVRRRGRHIDAGMASAKSTVASIRRDFGVGQTPKKLWRREADAIAGRHTSIKGGQSRADGWQRTWSQCCSSGRTSGSPAPLPLPPRPHLSSGCQQQQRLLFVFRAVATSQQRLNLRLPCFSSMLSS